MSRVAGRLVRALAAKAGTGVQADVSSEPWQSATFTGERHRIALTLSGMEAARALLFNLDDHQFDIPRTLVADIVASAPVAGDRGVLVILEALTIDDI